MSDRERQSGVPATVWARVAADIERLALENAALRRENRELAAKLALVLSRIEQTADKARDTRRHQG